MNNNNVGCGEGLAFAVTIENIQEEAKELIGRKLTEDELYTAIKGIQNRLLFDIETVFRTAIKEAQQGRKGEGK